MSRQGDRRDSIRRARLLLVAACIGIAISLAEGLVLVPSVRLVDVLILIAGAVGAGAALTGAVGQWNQARRSTTGPPDGEA